MIITTHYILNFNKVDDQRQRNERECPLGESEKEPGQNRESEFGPGSPVNIPVARA